MHNNISPESEYAPESYAGVKFIHSFAAT